MQRKHVVMREALKVGREKLSNCELAESEYDTDTRNSVSSTIP